MFRIAEENRTADGYLTHKEVADIMVAFDLDGEALEHPYRIGGRHSRRLKVGFPIAIFLRRGAS
jgi:hypothetical protein